MEDKKGTVRKLQFIYVTLFVGLALLMAMMLFFKHAVGPVLREEDYAEYGQAAFVAQTVLLLFLLGSVPLALKTMRFKFVRKQIAADVAQGSYLAYFMWAVRRFIPIQLGACLCAIAFIFTNSDSYLFCHLIEMVAMLFLWPSATRLEQEAGEVVQQGAWEDKRAK